MIAIALSSLAGCDLTTANRPPVAIVEADPMRGMAPVAVNFDGSQSTDIDGVIIQYLWDFGDNTTGSGPVVSHTFQRDGVYVVTLNVVDDDGARDEDRTRIIVGNPPPQAIFTTSTTSGWAPLIVSFDGSPSFNPEGSQINRYDWDFGDGTRAGGIRVTHNYQTAGQFTARLTITDLNGITNTAEALIQALDFRSVRDLRTGSSPTAILADDFDRDGALDLVVANSDSDDLSLFLGQSGELFFQAGVRIKAGSRPVGLASGDFNDDGYPDLAVASLKAGSLSLLINDRSRRFNPEQKITIGKWISSVIAADLDRDGDTDLAATDAGNDKVLILLGDGTGSFTQEEPVLVGNGPESLASGDFDNDGRPDLAITNFFDNSVQILLGDGAGRFTEGQVIRVGLGPTFIKAAHFNGDDRLDLIVTNSSGSTISILAGTGGARFLENNVIAAGRGVRTAELADFDGDGAMDIAAASPGADTITLMLNDGFGQFPQNRSKDFAEGESPETLLVADINRDNHADVVLVHFDDDRITLLINQL